MTAKTPNLLLCPFCGGTAETVTGPVPGKWGTRCTECGVWRDDRCDTESEAMAAWNRRAALSKQEPKT